MRINLIPVRSWEMMWNKIFRTWTQEGRISVTVMFAIATAICQIFQTQVALEAGKRLGHWIPYRRLCASTVNMEGYVDFVYIV